MVQRRDVFDPEVAADDKHGRRPNHGQGFEQSGRKPQQGLSRCLQDAVGGSAPVQAEVVDFHDDGDDAIDGGGEYKGDYAEAEDLCDERFADETRSAMTMISMERMKSVRMALRILSCSCCSGVCALSICVGVASSW